MGLASELKAEAARLGFNRVGIGQAVPSPTLNAYLAWVDAHMYATMHYLARPDRVERRCDMQAILPGVRSMIIVALDYHTLQIPQEVLLDPTRGRISNYAWGADYHDLMAPRLEQLAGWLAARLSSDVHHRVYVDTGAILERSHAQQTGLGFVGKNTMLIHPRRGSYCFLGEILTMVDFDQYDQSHPETMCGTCTRCLKACPTDAFPQPYVLDARRCISYLTIELKAAIPEELRSLTGNWVYGCDVCQEVCPWNRFAVESLESAFFPISIDRAAPKLRDLLSLTDEIFAQRFADSPIQRIGRERLVRNACVAAGNSGQQVLIPTLEPLAHADPSALVREHATWAFHRLTSLEL